MKKEWILLLLFVVGCSMFTHAQEQPSRRDTHFAEQVYKYFNSQLAKHFYPITSEQHRDTMINFLRDLHAYSTTRYDTVFFHTSWTDSGQSVSYLYKGKVINYYLDNHIFMLSSGRDNQYFSDFYLSWIYTWNTDSLSALQNYEGGHSYITSYDGISRLIYSHGCLIKQNSIHHPDAMDLWVDWSTRENMLIYTEYPIK